nr:carboxymuconolactone decarboxylase family protein [Pantoea stewartii]
MRYIVTSLNHRRSDWSSFEHTAPDVVVALAMLGKAVDDSGLEKSLTELIKLRASQLNACAFCLQYHLNLARKTDLSPVKMDLVAVWREAGIYSERECAALAWTEALTLMAQQPVSDAVYAEVSRVFDKQEIAFLTSAVAAINAWNRIAGALQFAPPVPKR